MSKVSSKVVLNQKVLNSINKESVRSLEQLGHAVLGDIIERQIVPFDVGTLQNSGSVDCNDSNKGSVKVSFSTPYARRLYYHPEYNFQKEGNPNARGKWMDDYTENGSKAKWVVDEYGKALKRNLK